MEIKAFRVKGRVQGVGYRYFVYNQAVKLGLNGFVKNLPDGDVYVVVSGPGDAIEKLVDLLWEGPSFAYVRGVTPVVPDSTDIPDGFHIRY